MAALLPLARHPPVDQNRRRRQTLLLMVAAYLAGVPQIQIATFTGAATQAAASAKMTAQRATGVSSEGLAPVKTKEATETDDAQFNALLTTLEADTAKGVLNELEARAAKAEALEAIQEEEPLSLPETLWQQIKSKLSAVLMVDIFSIIFLSFYFVGSAILDFAGVKQPLAFFMGVWDPYIQPMLGVFMGARIVSIGVMTVTKQSEE